MKRKICAVISVILIIASLVVFIYPDISKTENQKKNDEITERFDHAADDVQDGSREEAEDNGEVNEDGYLIDDNGVIFFEGMGYYQTGDYQEARKPPARSRRPIVEKLVVQLGYP